MTPLMKRVMEAIEALMRENGGICPTFEEISMRSCVTKSGVKLQVDRLIAAGYLKRIPGMTRRGLVVVKSIAGQTA